jgi:hypothetical protein
MKVTLGNWPNLQIILLVIWSLGNAIFAWSILLWITYRIESLEGTNSNLQIWYKFLHYSWCKLYFFNFSSYSFALLFVFLNLEIKSFRDSHIIHFAKTNLCFKSFNIYLIMSYTMNSLNI